MLLLATCVLLGAGLAPRTGLAKRLAVLEFKGSALTSEGLGSKLRLTTNSYDTRSGNLLRTAEAAAGDVDGLIAGLPAACRELFAPEAPPPPPPPPSSRPRLVVGGRGQARAEVGWLRVEGRPPGAYVKVTGPEGFSRQVSLPHTLDRLEPGMYRVEVASEGYVPQAMDRAVQVDLTTLVQVDLERPGSLTVVGEPAGAEVVFLDAAGASVGRAYLPDVVAQGLAPGRYRVTVTRKGYQAHESEHDVAAGERELVEVALEREHQAAREGPAGIDWVRLPGGTFEMGSESGEDDEKPVHRVRVRSFEIARR